MRYVGHGLSAAYADLYRGLRQVVGAEREIHMAALACAQVNALESAQTPYRRLLTSPASDVQLHYFIAVPGRSVFDRCVDCGRFWCPLRAQPRIFKGRIAQPKAERVQGFALKIPVGSALHGIIGEWGQLIHALVECHRKTARRVTDTGQSLLD